MEKARAIVAAKNSANFNNKRKRDTKSADEVPSSTALKDQFTYLYEELSFLLISFCLASLEASTLVHGVILQGSTSPCFTLRALHRCACLAEAAQSAPNGAQSSPYTPSSAQGSPADERERRVSRHSTCSSSW